MESGMRGHIAKCCYECDERFEACHDVCATYLKALEEWRELQNRINKAKYELKIYERYHYERVLKQHKVNRNKKGN